jgi:hypothetical protein
VPGLGLAAGARRSPGQAAASGRRSAGRSAHLSH